MRNYFEKSVSKITTFVVMILLMHCALAWAAPPTAADCTGPDPFPDPDSCTSFYQCFYVNRAWMLVHLDCPPGGMYDDAAKSCVVGTCENPTTTTVPTTTTTVPTTTTSATTPPVTIVCTSAGVYPFPGSCSKYYRCILLGNSFVNFVYECPPGSYYNAATGLCSMGQCGSTSPTTATTTTNPATTTTALATTTTLAPDNPCVAEGYIADPADCQSYYRCMRIGGQMYRYKYTCPATYYWNNSLADCIVGTCPTAGKSLA